MRQDNVQVSDDNAPEHSEGIRVGRKLLEATRPYVEQSAATSWWRVASTFVLMIIALTAAGLVPWWPLRLMFSVLGGLLIVRAFITFHDYLHGAILKNSRVAYWLFHAFGALMLTPTRSWLASHNYHHGHVGQISEASVGAFPLITTRMWRDSTRWQRFTYRAQRNPLVVLLSYPIVFGFNITLLPFLRAPVKYLDSLAAMASHAALMTVVWVLGGFTTVFFVVLLPMTLASAMGCYLFFAQHSFRRMQIASPEAWTFYRGAMESSSFMRMNKVMQWFTGNIGYHHIHHLNVRIPFYRLPEVMAAIPELQSPATTSLAPGEIADCFRYALWDEEKQRMVSYREAGG
ncbi:omega-6 fatty acid desaturase (delta-12 desaturase) [Marinobacter gudaonensis]|uniref:Omega-6 fatty acid desaturase (Delta-12 desaturase) n=1 Tax=Marinobacter gudaonensis TaxID=375760 RepID=A0A1I6HT61_9GAMM|nr:fatty acid desaturase [Marinobacter gudaonensis]SFR57641.1 omega-6 fatty acid desaturase (delta-12 desaturase) [Marinobacter gudaonensis]